MLSNVIFDFQFGIQDSRRECLFLVNHPSMYVFHLSSLGSLLRNNFSVPMNFNRFHKFRVILSIN
jgi:hypothetical protein